MPILGAHQAENAATAIAAVEAFLGAGSQPIHEEVLRTALADATSPGRLQILSQQPLMVLDGAHNSAGAKALANAWRDYLGAPSTVGLISMLQDKNIEETLSEFVGMFDRLIVTEADSPRALSAGELGEIAKRILQIDVIVEPDLKDALQVAKNIAQAQDSALLVTGSLYLAGNVLGLNQAELLVDIESDDYEES